MLKPTLNKDFYDRLGTYIFIGSLIFYFLLKLPFNLSVLCSSTNEGFYFIFGQHFLNGMQFNPPERPCLTLFVLVYALILKIFGFGTWSIIAVHFIQTVLVVLIGILMFLIMDRLLDHRLYAGLTVLFWILLQLTPIGLWGYKLELGAIFALEAEYFILLFSFLSFYILMKLGKSERWSVYFISGLIASMPIMFKASGGVFIIAIFSWFLYMAILGRDLFFYTKSKVIFLFAGIIIGLLLFNIFLLSQNISILKYWKHLFFVGMYSNDYTRSFKLLLQNVFNFMTRYVPSVSNLILFFFSILGAIWIILKRYFIVGILKMSAPLILLAIWGVGNMFSVIVPGGYGAYYYVLVWPFVAIFITFLIKDLFDKPPFLQRSFVKAFGGLLISIFIALRIYNCLPLFLPIVYEQNNLNLFNQPESFQENVQASTSVNPKQVNLLKAADILNKFLPNKNDTIYILNSLQGKLNYFPITSYIYTKRMPPTTAVSDYLFYKMYIDNAIKTLISDLTKMPPKIIVFPQNIVSEEWNLKKLSALIKWLDEFLLKNYHFKSGIRYSDEKTNLNVIYNVYERNW